MDKFNSTEELLAWIIDFFATHFGNSAILKGGMSLRLMHSPRYTNDVDYIFIPFDSKKNAKSFIESELKKVPNLEFQTGINSKALRILVNYGGQSAQIEISTEKECDSIPMSSSLLSSPYGRPNRIIRIQEPATAFAHKIAAWNERELLRDLYDIYQYKSAFHLSPKWQILKERLKKARSYKNVKAAKDFNTLIKKLSAAADTISEKTLKELRPLLNPEEMAGLEFRLKAAMLTLCEEMEKACH